MLLLVSKKVELSKTFTIFDYDNKVGNEMESNVTALNMISLIFPTFPIQFQSAKARPSRDSVCIHPFATCFVEC